jgi:hypothetical protein
MKGHRRPRMLWQQRIEVAGERKGTPRMEWRVEDGGEGEGEKEEEVKVKEERSSSTEAEEVWIKRKSEYLLRLASGGHPFPGVIIKQ